MISITMPDNIDENLVNLALNSPLSQVCVQYLQVERLFYRNEQKFLFTNLQTL